MNQRLKILGTPPGARPVSRVLDWIKGAILGIDASMERRQVIDQARLDEPGFKAPRRITCRLGEGHAFAFVADLPRGSSAAHVKALSLRLNDLAPIDPEALVAVAKPVSLNGDVVRYLVVMARSSDLDEVFAKGRALGARDVVFEADGNHGVGLVSPDQADRRAKKRLIDLGFAGVAALSIAVSLQLWGRSLEADTAELLAAEREARAAALAIAGADAEARAVAQLVQDGVLTQTPGRAGRDLAELTIATPNSAWWTRAHWTAGAVTIQGVGTDAANALSELAKSAPDWSVVATGPIQAGQAGEAFEATLSRSGAEDG